MIYDILPINNYKGNNSSTTFDFDFYIDNKNQLSVYHFDKDKIKRLLKLDIDYSINEIKNKNGSYITFPLEGSEFSILNENENLSLELTLPVAQEVQYNNSSLLNLEALEYSLDYLTRLIQVLSRKLDLCVKVEECSDITPNEIIDGVNAKAVAMSEALSNVLNLKEQVENFNTNIQAIDQKITKYSEKFDKIDELEIKKANAALDNLSDIGKKVISGQWVTANATVVSGATIKGDKPVQYDVSSIFPDVDSKYEFIYQLEYAPATRYTTFYVAVDGISQAWKQDTAGQYLRSCGVFPISSRSITCKANGDLTNVGFVVLAYRRIGTNE